MKTIKLLSLVMLLGFTTGNSQEIDDYNLLMLEFARADNVKEHLEVLGHTVTIKPFSDIVEGFDYSDYDAILLPGKDEVIPGFSEIVALNEQHELGIVLLRGNRTINGALGFVGSGNSARGKFHIKNNTHYITQPFEIGELDLGIGNVATINLDWRTLENITTLGRTKSGTRSLITHNNYRRVFSPFTGMDRDGGNPISDAGLVLFDRIIAWAVSTPSKNNFDTAAALVAYLTTDIVRGQQDKWIGIKCCEDPTEPCVSSEEIITQELMFGITNPVSSERIPILYWSEETGAAGPNLADISYTETIYGDRWVLDGQIGSDQDKRWVVISAQDNELVLAKDAIDGEYHFFSLNGSTLSNPEITKNKITLHPNPSTDFIKLSGLNTTEDFKIYSILGTVVKTGSVSNNKNIDIQNLSKGMYFMRLKNGGASKFIKN